MKYEHRRPENSYENYKKLSHKEKASSDRSCYTCKYYAVRRDHVRCRICYANEELFRNWVYDPDSEFVQHEKYGDRKL